MKKKLFLFIVSAVTLLSCNKDSLVPEEEIQPITFSLTAKHPDATKAVKTAWEAGDAIFVFFTGVAAPKHLKMSYDGSKWTSAEYDGATLSEGALGLKNGDEGTMRAVFLPFGSEATVSADGTNFTFDKTYYTYFLTATLDYAVTDNKISGAFNMEIPDGYVQFYVEDASATDEAYSLGCDAIIPSGLSYITAECSFAETSDKTFKDDMIGYAYQGGHLFSGLINHTYSYKGYYFAKTKAADGSRADYFVTGKTLTSLSAVKLPSNDNIYDSESYGANGKWIPVGKNEYVNLRKSDGAIIGGNAWATCNYNQSQPESEGYSYTYAQAIKLGTLPSNSHFDLLTNKSTDYFTYLPLTIHGKRGFVIRASKGFIFLPVTLPPSYCEYWSSASVNDSQAWYCSFTGTSDDCMYGRDKTESLAVRLIR